VNNFDTLKADFPDMYSDVYCGCEHPEGWNKLVYELSQQLSLVPVAIRVTQTKEKFGGLRFYVDYVVDEPTPTTDIAIKLAYNIITYTEHRSLTTCQDCGEWGHLNTKGWLLTLCKECATKRGR